jgi:SAM-dependent methyltransferase
MPDMTAPTMFDTSLYLKRRERALANTVNGAKDPWFLHKFACDGTVEVLEAIKQNFSCAAEVFSGNGHFQEAAYGAGLIGAGRKLEKLLQIEPSLAKDSRANCLSELILPSLAPNNFDLIVSNSGLNWINDLPGFLLQVRKSLQPNGNFISTFLGGVTLNELRQCFLDVEAEHFGGASPRISPMINCETGVGLLVRAGFQSPVSSSEVLKVRYSSVFDLFRDIKAMGDASAFAQKGARPLTRNIISKVADCYQTRYRDDDDRIYASFELVTLSGWAN